MSSTDSASLGSLIADTERMMREMDAADAATMRHTQASGTEQPSRTTTTTTTTSSSSASFSSPARHTVRVPSPSRMVHALPYSSPSRLLISPSRSVARALSPSYSSLTRSVAYSSPRLLARSPLSPRQQARAAIREVERALSPPARNTLRSPVRSSFASPSRFDATVPAAPVPTGSSFVRAASASPLRSTTTTRSAFDSPLRYDSLSTPLAPSTAAALNEAASIRAAAAALASASSVAALASSTSSSSASAAAAAALAPYVHIPATHWSELNRYLSLHSLPLISPFPVPSSLSSRVLLGDSALWSPSTARLLRSLPDQTPSSALLALVQSFTSLLADYHRRGAQVADLNASNAAVADQLLQAKNDTTAASSEIQHLRRNNTDLLFELRETQQSLDATSLDRSSQIQLLSSDLHSLRLLLQQTQQQLSSSTQREREQETLIAEIRREAESAALRSEQHLRLEGERFSSLLREKDVVAAQIANENQEKQRQLTQRAEQLEEQLSAAQQSLRSLGDSSARRESELLYSADLDSQRHTEELRMREREFQAANEQLKLEMAQREEQWGSQNRTLLDRLDYSQAEVSKGNQVCSLLQSDVSSLSQRNAAQEAEIRNLQLEKKAQEQIITEMEGKINGLQSWGLQLSRSFFNR